MHPTHPTHPIHHSSHVDARNRIKPNRHHIVENHLNKVLVSKFPSTPPFFINSVNQPTSVTARRAGDAPPFHRPNTGSFIPIGSIPTISNIDQNLINKVLVSNYRFSTFNSIPPPSSSPSSSSSSSRTDSINVSSPASSYSRRIRYADQRADTGGKIVRIIFQRRQHGVDFRRRPTEIDDCCTQLWWEPKSSLQESLQESPKHPPKKPIITPSSCGRELQGM